MEELETVRVIDWEKPENNDFFLASQFWISGDMYKRRTDLVGFVNGIPLLFVELKASHRNVKNAYNDNLRDYKDTIPQLFWYNAVILLSNGSQAKVGSLTSQWEHFSDWKKINSEGEEGRHLSGDRPARHLRARPLPGYHRKLYPLHRSPGRPQKTGRQEPPVPRCE